MSGPPKPTPAKLQQATRGHFPFATVEVTDLRRIRDVAVPAAVKFRQIIVTGSPCSGKSTLVKQLGGWPEEGYLDLAQERWWNSRILTFRPREVHFGIPFKGCNESQSVFDSEWGAHPAEIDSSRILLPPPKRGFLSVDWRKRYAFDFQIPPPERIYAISRERIRAGTHPVDAGLTLELVRRQVFVYVELARFFNRNGMVVYLRDRLDGPPLLIVDPDAPNEAGGT